MADDSNFAQYAERSATRSSEPRPGSEFPSETLPPEPALRLIAAESAPDARAPVGQPLLGAGALSRAVALFHVRAAVLAQLPADAHAPAPGVAAQLPVVGVARPRVAPALPDPGESRYFAAPRPAEPLLPRAD